ncbi:MAG: 4Fe-4S binding protein [Chloroflexota bacterium]
MNGKGLLKGLSVTAKRFLDSYLEDIRWLGKKATPEKIAFRSSKDARGTFTVQFPEEKLPTPEEFRYIPFLVYDEAEGNKEIRCTSCGICAKVCPPQCIWIVRTNDPETGKPIPQPAEFYIDADICMNCGLCAEYCPFDAIKMDHDYEIASYNRNVLNLDKLMKPASYYAGIRPLNNRREEEARAAKAAAKAAAVAAKAE